LKEHCYDEIESDYHVTEGKEHPVNDGR
jgi:hypothetical protein